MRLEQVVFVPAAALLIPAVARGAAHELDVVRAAIKAQLSELGDSRVLVVGSSSMTNAFRADSSISLIGVGVNSTEIGPDVSGKPLPTTLSVGAWLCRDSAIAPIGFVGIDTSNGDAAIGEALALVAAEEPTALVVVGDGSARRSPAAPGAYDQRAAALDSSIERCLAEVDVAGLAQLDRELCDDLLVGGRAPWQVAANAIGDSEPWRGTAQMFDPYGVAYFVARWERTDG